MENQYGPKGLQIFAFPCNQFAGQEPGTPEKIAEFAERREAKFPFFEKLDVNGAKTHPVYQFLKENSSLEGEKVPHNFAKFLADATGQNITFFKPGINPLKILPDIEPLLK